MNDLACPKQQRCPGCPLGDAPYQVGLARKGHELSDALARYPELTPRLAAARAATPTLAYRLRAKLVSHGRALGLFERGSHRVIDVEGCRVLSPPLTAATAALRRLLPLPIYGADLRETSEGVLITLLSESDRAALALEQVAQELVSRGDALSVAVAVRPPDNFRLLAGEPRVVAGPSAARHALAESAPYAYAAHGGFVQAHAGQASYVQQQIVRRVQGVRKERPRVLELFAGNGSLALQLARTGADVTAVEAYAPAIALSERAAREQGLALRAVAADATRFMLEERPGEHDVVLVNPPRRGLDRALREAIARAKPALVGYVSCNPRTLSRDAAHLALAGLSLSEAEPLDMIPWSDAIEALCWLTPRPAPAPRVLYRDARFIAVEKAAFEPTEAAAGPSLGARVRALPGCESAVALSHFSAELSGVSWFALEQLTGVPITLHQLTLGVQGTLRKQGTITRKGASSGTRYKLERTIGRHSVVSAIVRDDDEQPVCRDFASIGHPVLGDEANGARPTNQFFQHRFGLDRSFLHCHESRLELPDGSSLSATSPLAPDLAEIASAAARSDQTASERG